MQPLPREEWLHVRDRQAAGRAARLEQNDRKRTGRAYTLAQIKSRQAKYKAWWISRGGRGIQPPSFEP